MMDLHKMVTGTEAREVMSVFLNTPAVLGIEVVGSVARKGYGNDLDLVLVVDQYTYASFVRAMCAWFGDGGENAYYDGFKAARRQSAFRLLRLSPLLEAWLLCATRDIVLDLHLMPTGWQEHIGEVQGHLPHNDRNFVANIARDAVKVTGITLPNGLVMAAW